MKRSPLSGEPSGKEHRSVLILRIEGTRVTGKVTGNPGPTKHGTTVQADLRGRFARVPVMRRRDAEHPVHRRHRRGPSRPPLEPGGAESALNARPVRGVNRGPRAPDSRRRGVYPQRNHKLAAARSALRQRANLPGASGKVRSLQRPQRGTTWGERGLTARAASSAQCPQASPSVAAQPFLSSSPSKARLSTTHGRLGSSRKLA